MLLVHFRPLLIKHTALTAVPLGYIGGLNEKRNLYPINKSDPLDTEYMA